MEEVGASKTETKEQRGLGERLDDVGWAVLFLMSGAILAVPGIPNPWAAWFIGLGAVLLGVNVARYAMGLRVHLLISGCGAIAVAAGIGAYVGIDIPFLALVLILIGAVILVGPLANRNAQGA